MQVRKRTVVAAMVSLGFVGTMLASAPLAVADQAEEALQKARAALGGEGALENVTALAAEGTFRREMGQRQMEGTLTLTIERPDRMHRSEDMEMPGGASMERISAIAGDASWDDVQNRGGMGRGGMFMTFRGPDGEQPNPEAMAQARTRRLKGELNRWLLAFLASSEQQLTHVGVAEAPEGTADVLEMKDDRGRPVRLFIDQKSGMPLMLTFQELRPRMTIAGGPGGPRGGGAGRGQGGRQADPEELERRMEAERSRLQAEGPPPPTTVNLYLADYKDVRGVKLPHRITESADGKPMMEWTIEKFEINPKIKSDFFEKK